MFLPLLALIGPGAWSFTESVDPMTDAAKAQALLEGDNAAIVFVCTNGGAPDLFYMADEFLGGNGIGASPRRITYRFDNGQAVSTTWRYVDRVARPMSQESAAAFASKMMQARKLVIRALRYDGRQIDSTFDLTGSAEVFGQAFRRCQIGTH